MKKATIFSYSSDMLGWVVLIIGIIFWVVILMFNNNQKKIEINEKADSLSNIEVLSSILKYDILPGKTYGDIVIECYMSKDSEGLTKITKEVLEPVYNKGDTICWRIYFDDVLFAKEDCKTLLDTPFLDANLTIPIPSNTYKKTADFRLQIPGFNT